MMGRKIPKIQQVLNLYGLILFLWSIYRWKLGFPTWFDEFIAKPIVFVLPVYIFITHIEKKGFVNDIWLKTKDFLGDLAISGFLGVTFVGSALFANYIRTGSLDISPDLASGGLLLAILIPFATAISEEILARGFILKRFFEDSGNVYISAFNASVLFLILHIPILFTIPDLRGSLLIMFLATDFILGLVNSFVYLDRKSLVAPILIHAFYNIAILLYI